MAHRKNAVIEVQFNWIFILIAGALILFLFSSIILKQKTTADSTAQTTLLKDITSIAIGSESSTGVTKPIPLSKATISFDCNTIRVGTRTQPLQQMVVFSPTSVQTPLMVHTREWSLPFRATNVVYLSSPKIRYVLIGDTDLARLINKSMPEKFLVNHYRTYTDFSNAPLQKDEAIRVVFFDKPGNPSEFNLVTFPQDLSSFPHKAISVLIVKDTSNENIGDLTFYQKTQTGWQSPVSANYLKKEMLIGAIFTDSAEQYKCIQANMLRKLRMVATIHDNRRRQFFIDTTPPTNPYNKCNSRYNSPSATHFNDLKTKTSFQELFDAAGPNGLSLENKELEKNSCPLLY